LLYNIKSTERANSCPSVRFTNMTIVFNGDGRNDVRTISTAHINDVSINGVPIRNLVDYGDDRWYPRTLKSPTDDSNVMY